MKKILFIVKWLGLALVALVVVIMGILIKNAKEQEKQQTLMIKQDTDLIGKHFYMPREGKEAVDMNLYFHEEGVHPLIINVHGGAFIAGDADTLDLQSDRLSRQWKANIATINYKLAKGKYDIAYGTQEVIDTVKYFMENAEQYHIDPNQVFILGYSAGGYHAMAATLALKQEGITIAGQMIAYGFIKEVNDTYLAQSESFQQTMPPSLFILADNDPISEGSLIYQQSLQQNGVPTEVKKFTNSLHGFIEENNPEYEQLKTTSKSPEQEVLAREAEEYIHQWFEKIKSQ